MTETINNPRIADHIHQLATSAADLIINEDTPLHTANGVTFDAVVARVENLMLTAYQLGQSNKPKEANEHP